jgi:hypothetical protein
MRLKPSHYAKLGALIAFVGAVGLSYIEHGARGAFMAIAISGAVLFFAAPIFCLAEDLLDPKD